MPRAVIFDLDGTLLDTLRDLADSTNAALRALGAPSHPLGEYRRLVGEGMEQLVRDALPPERRDEATVQRGLALLKREYAARWRVHTRAYDGIPEVLDALAARAMPMAILSNKIDPFTREMVAHFLGRWVFRSVRGSRPEVPRKPDPAAALSTARVLGHSPAEIAFVGDTRVDMETARAAGMQPVGVLWGFRDVAELAASGAQHLAREPQELLAILV